MKSKLNIFLLGIFLVMFVSCQVAHEIHFFKSGKNYYRIIINESSFASKARYMSGFYDEAAVDRYFSEMSQPIEKDSTKASDVAFINPVASASSQDKVKLDSNKQFVMILSSNSNAISEQIGAFAENDQILNSIASLSNKGKIDENNNYLNDISNSYTRNKAVIDLGDQFINSLNNTDDVTKVKNNMSIFLQFIKDQKINNTTGAELLMKSFQ